MSALLDTITGDGTARGGQTPGTWPETGACPRHGWAWHRHGGPSLCPPHPQLGLRPLTGSAQSQLCLSPPPPAASPHPRGGRRSAHGAIPQPSGPRPPDPGRGWGGRRTRGPTPQTQGRWWVARRCTVPPRSSAAGPRHVGLGWCRGSLGTGRGGGEPEGLLHGDSRGSAPDCGMATGSRGGRGPHRHRLLPSRPQTVCWSGPGAPRCLRRQARPCLWRGIPGGACREEGGSGSAAEWPSARAQVAGPLCDSNTLVLGCRPQGLPGGRSGSSLHRAALQGRLRTRPHKPALPSAPTEPPGCLVHGRPGVSQVSWGRGQGRLRQEAQAGGPW